MTGARVAPRWFATHPTEPHGETASAKPANKCDAAEPLKNFEKPPLVIALAGALLLILPVVMALVFAWNSAMLLVNSDLRATVSDVLQRSEHTGDQTEFAFSRLQASGHSPCSAEHLQLMRDLALRLEHLQAIAYVVDNRVICSSYGPGDSGIQLGPIDFVSAARTRFHMHMRFNFGQEPNLIGLERDRYLAVANRELAINTSPSTTATVMALYAIGDGRMLASHGAAKPDWFERVAPGSEKTQFKHDQLLMLRASSERQFVAAAAVPASLVYSTALGLAVRAIPIGLLCGALLAVGLYYLFRQQTSLPTAIRHALRRKEFYLEYQPVVDLRDGHIAGAEALLRWKRPDGKIIRPDLFIPVAESVGLISDITSYVLDVVERECCPLLCQHPELHLAVNVAAADLVSDRLPARLRQLLRTTGISPASLLIEATERGFLDPSQSLPVIQALHNLGLRIAIDDFGTGYSNLSYLGSMSMDCLKIDKSFIDALGTDAPTNQVALHIIELAKSLGITMVAEGVEHSHQADFLRKEGVEYAQGWLFGKPMSWTQFCTTLGISDEALLG